MADIPVRKTENLRKGRISLPGARYFVTACVRDRLPALTGNEQRQRMFAVMDELTATADWELLAGTVMPDHFHVLFTLGERLPLHRVMAKLKSKARRPGSGWRWQANVFEHRLRPDEKAEDYAFYIFMNPYRSGLIRMGLAWPGWWRKAGWSWVFEEGLNEKGGPPDEWLDRMKVIAARIRTGE